MTYENYNCPSCRNEHLNCSCRNHWKSSEPKPEAVWSPWDACEVCGGYTKKVTGTSILHCGNSNCGAVSKLGWEGAEVVTLHVHQD